MSDRGFRLRFLALILSTGLAWVNLAGPPQNGPHEWDRITYPSVKIGENKALVDFVILNDEHLRGLRFDILLHGGPKPPEVFTSGMTGATLVREDGTSAMPLDGNPLQFMGGAGKAVGSTWASIAWFPWGDNHLRCAWIQVKIGQQAFCLELPYGFDRNPSATYRSDDDLGNPQRPVQIRSKTIIPWQAVYYDFGEIQNGWGLSTIQSNSGAANSEVILYRDDGAVGKSIYLWDLHTPRTVARISEANGIIGGKCMKIRLHGDGMRRSDFFRFTSNVNRKREWGRIEITVGDKTYQRHIPSSLFRIPHGHSQP